ncbi:uncharacterized protein LOC130719474 [Lotus japonicus]|uniref:uncharacterized protein LOC130719474 n=1 Tax=Lotus japonicus TaxID=34305 RepID=UPI00258D1B87|nr:uncharacterized protein LOC130719474 [Lotus japonicus]
METRSCGGQAPHRRGGGRHSGGRSQAHVVRPELEGEASSDGASVAVRSHATTVPENLVQPGVAVRFGLDLKTKLPTPETDALGDQQAETPVRAPDNALGASSAELKQVLDTIQAVQRQNEHLQAQVEYLNQIRDLRRGQRVDAEDVVDFQPFAPIVAVVEISEHLQTLTLDMYGGDTDPIDHLRYFNTKMVIGGATDAVKCSLLPSTFKGVAMTWFIKQPPYSISNFTDLSTKFLTQFSANQTQKATPTDLFNIRQHVDERIKTYMARFSRVSVQLEDASPEVCVAAFKNGLRCGSLNKDLTRRPAKDMMDLRARTHEFILVEQDEQTKKDRDN